MLVFDCETNGLLDEVSVVHCVNMQDTETGRTYRYNDKFDDADGSVEEGVRRLEEAADIGGHNVHGYDVPALKKIFPWFEPRGKVHDSMAYARLIWADVEARDYAAIRRGKRPQEFSKKGLVGSHSLAAWGYRLGEYKGDFKGPWDEFTRQMDDYCVQDVEVTARLFKLIFSKDYSVEALDLENAVQRIISRQERYGFAFDVAKAEKLLATLQRRHAELTTACTRVFKPWCAPHRTNGTAIFTPKRDNKKMGYTAGVPFTKVRLVVFNPSSRDHIADRLQTIYGWKPKELTPGGKPKVDETTLEGLPYPEAKLLQELLMVEKRLGQLADGKQAWLKLCEDDDRIHGRVNANGAVTGRMTHFRPNVAQTPSLHNKRGAVPYGRECRELFRVPEGRKLVGCDAEGLELRALGHYMARYDSGDFADRVVSGNKADGTDVHTYNMQVVGLHSRDGAKTFKYAYIYGAQDFKLGTIVVDDFPDEKKRRFFSKYPAGSRRSAAIKRLGARARSRIEEGLPALGKVRDKAEKAAAKNGHLKGPDGRLLAVRSRHATLNTLLQGAGAIAMKKALVLADVAFQEELGLTPGVDYEFVANVHDEWQIEALEEHAEAIGQAAAEAIRRAGDCFGFRCQLAGDYVVGDNWAETH